MIQKISQQLNLQTSQVENTLKLLEEGATIPFIARYRKERTNQLDEVQIKAIRDLHEQFTALEKRKISILESLEENGFLNPELEQKIKQTDSLSELEDIYLPYKPKRRTRATIAIDKGLSAAIVNPEKIIPIFKISDKERKLVEDLLFNKTNDSSALTKFMNAFEGKVIKKKINLETLLPNERLTQKVLEGDASHLETLVTELLSEMKPEAIINKILLSAMKQVGELFGSGQLQLPFVLQSAEVVKRTVGILEPLMDKKEPEADRKLILATVSGDVHDIGKNLVNIMLANNGFSVFDLGIKVDIDTMIKSVEKPGRKK